MVVVDVVVGGLVVVVLSDVNDPISRVSARLKIEYQKIKPNNGFDYLSHY